MTDIQKPDYRSICETARAAFEDRLKATGLEVWPTRLGYIVAPWGNKGVNVCKVLEEAGIDYQLTGQGAPVVTSWPFEQRAMQEADRAARAAMSQPTPS